MLRPEQISNARFTPVSAGSYSSDEVDAFLAVVAQAYQ
ncbi:MAG: DivIVA domain-containing protein, partial [Clostridia bacterium]|nr:DivIVA domain-containing protein [Clostridia bacterium]